MSFAVLPDDTLEPAEFYGRQRSGYRDPCSDPRAAGGDSMKFEVETVRVFPDDTIDIDTILATGKDAVTPTDRRQALRRGRSGQARRHRGRRRRHHHRVASGGRRRPHNPGRR